MRSSQTLDPLNSDSSATTCSKTPMNQPSQNSKTIPPIRTPAKTENQKSVDQKSPPLTQRDIGKTGPLLTNSNAHTLITRGPLLGQHGRNMFPVQGR